MSENGKLLNYVNGDWVASTTMDYLPVLNPATQEALGQVPLSTADELDTAVSHAAAAYESWKKVPPGDRIQYLFKLKMLLEEKKKAGE